MLFETITIKNFRQYFGENSLDLSCSKDKNIVLIGGKNGFGKTNLLLSVVWCLYGDKISQVDDNFHKEISKEKNYNAFMQQSLNWKAKGQGVDEFSVSIKISDIHIPFKSNDFDYSELTITRTYKVQSMKDQLIIADKNGNPLYEDYEDKINFINDFIIPIDAAKFVFFDAEKISEVANLSIKDEGSFINDAFSKVLGLDVYEQLIVDLKKYIQSLKKNDLTGSVESQVKNIEKTLDNKIQSIQELEDDNARLSKDIETYESSISEYKATIEREAPEISSIDRDELINEKNKLETEIKRLEEEFNILGEVIPLVILSGKLSEVIDHLGYQEEIELIEANATKNKKKIEEFIESLFNKPPEPDGSSMTLRDKLFYYEKAKALSNEFFSSSEVENELLFEHDFTNADKNLIEGSLAIVDTKNTQSIEDITSRLNGFEIKLGDITNKLNRLDADEVDEYISELINKRNRLEEKVAESIRSIGANEARIDQHKKEQTRLNTQLDGLLQKIKVSEVNQKKISIAEQYINVLNEFVSQQKSSKKSRIESNILLELQKLMHKLGSGSSDFINEVEVNILPEGQGMKVSLFNDNDEELKKESLSQGEKQLYISSLIKAILKESLYPLPIFIDTPLGRLDDEHISNILEYYYPNLSDQVVLLSTNNEITPLRYQKIEQHVAKSYLISNDGKNSQFISGYFKGQKND